MSDTGHGDLLSVARSALIIFVSARFSSQIFGSDEKSSVNQISSIPDPLNVSLSGEVSECIVDFLSGRLDAF